MSQQVTNTELYEDGEGFTVDYDKTVCVASESATAKVIGVFSDEKAARNSELVKLFGRGGVTYEIVAVNPTVEYEEGYQ